MENRSLTYMLFSFQGRMSRSEYWLRYTIPLLLLYVAMFVLVIVLSLVFGVAQFVAQLLSYYSMSADAPDLTAMAVVGFILIVLFVFAASVAFFWAGIAGAVKRLHDCNQTGWLYLLIFFPGIGPLVLFVWNGFIRGTVGENKFGPDPNDLPGDTQGDNSNTSA